MNDTGALPKGSFGTAEKGLLSGLGSAVTCVESYATAVAQQCPTPARMAYGRPYDKIGDSAKLIAYSIISTLVQYTYSTPRALTSVAVRAFPQLLHVPAP